MKIKAAAFLLLPFLVLSCTSSQKYSMESMPDTGRTIASDAKRTDATAADIHLIKTAHVKSNANSALYTSAKGALILGIFTAGAYKLYKVVEPGTHSDVAYISHVANSATFRFLVNKLGSNSVFYVADLSGLAAVGGAALSLGFGAATGYFAMTGPAEAATIDDLAKRAATAEGFNDFLRYDEKWMVELVAKNSELRSEIANLANEIRN